MTDLTDFQRVVHDPLAANLRHTHANLDFCIKQRTRYEEALRAILAVRLYEELTLDNAVQRARVEMRRIAEEALRG